MAEDLPRVHNVPQLHVFKQIGDSRQVVGHLCLDLYLGVIQDSISDRDGTQTEH